MVLMIYPIKNFIEYFAKVYLRESSSRSELILHRTEISAGRNTA